MVKQINFAGQTNDKKRREESSKKLDVLLKEKESATQEIIFKLGTSEKMLSVGVAAIAAGLSYGIKEKISLVVLLMPILLFGLSLFWLDKYYGMLILGGYKKSIEDEINLCIGERVVFWEEMAHTNMHSSITNVSFFIFFCVFLGMVVVSALYYLWSSIEYRLFMSAATLVWLVMFISSLRKVFGAHDLSYNNSTMLRRMGLIPKK